MFVNNYDIYPGVLHRRYLSGHATLLQERCETQETRGGSKNPWETPRGLMGPGNAYLG